MKKCPACAEEIQDEARKCRFCGEVLSGISAGDTTNNSLVTISGRRAQLVILPKSRAAFVLLGLFLGGLGIHNFYAGYVGRGIAQLLITLCTFWLIVPIFIVWGWVIIEVIVVTKDARGLQFG